MAGAATGAKRARAAAFSAHERYMHKSGVVLQREGKKIRAFLVRKVVAQLKQSREQHTQATSAVADIPDETKRKRAQGKAKKLYYQVQKLETELAALKTLDLKAVVARAFAKTGLKEDEVPDDGSEDERPVKMTAHEREMQKYGRGRVEKEEVAEEEEEEEDGFNSEDYDDVAKSDSDSNSDEESGDENSEHAHGGEDAQGDDEDVRVVEAEDGTDGAVLVGPMGPPGSPADKETHVAPEQDEPTQTTADAAMLEQLLDRVLAHNQMQPFLDAIRQYVAKREKEQAKKLRQKEKSALKRARASMIGGRSAAAPTSMFFGSLSGAGPDDDDDAGVDDDEMGLRLGSASMAGADDDIAEFLGETKKKKNRAGQMARRQKAIRMEEARRNEQNGGGFHKRRDAPVGGKYGPSERPKKQAKRDRGEAKPRAREPDRAASWQDRQTTNVPRSGKETTTTTRPERRGGRSDDSARGKPTAPKAPQRKPEAAPSHPSWLAKQALKEKMKVDITAFSGKKITFGDD